jgi:hypothetical protein
MRLARVAAAFAAGVVAAAAAAGCGGPAAGEVAGLVTLDGTPVGSGAISFIPADGKAPTAGGAIVDGKYNVANVPVGTAKVVINGSKVVGKKALYGPGSPERATYGELLPDRYNDKSELTFEVKHGPQTKDWELSSKK